MDYVIPVYPQKLKFSSIRAVKVLLIIQNDAKKFLFNETNEHNRSINVFPISFEYN